MNNLEIERLLKDYPVTVCCANELPATIKKRPQTFVVNTGHALNHLSLSSRRIVGILRFRGKRTRNIPPALPKRVTSQWTHFSVYTGQTTTRGDEHVRPLRYLLRNEAM